MIRVKNLEHFVIPLHVPGTISAGASKACAVVPFPGKIVNIYAKQGTAGGGDTNTIADLNLNGTTIFDTSVKITTAATSGTVTYSALDSRPTDVAAGDILTLDVDQAGTSGANLCVLVTIAKNNPGTETNLADHNTVV
jgi:hypothetical protein